MSKTLSSNLGKGNVTRMSLSSLSFCLMSAIPYTETGAPSSRVHTRGNTGSKGGGAAPMLSQAPNPFHKIDLVPNLRKSLVSVRVSDDPCKIRKVQGGGHSEYKKKKVSFGQWTLCSITQVALTPSGHYGN